MEEIKCTLEKEGFIAHYYPGTKEKSKAIISVGGASCDEKTSIAMAGYLRKAGYNVLVLGFYLWKGLSKNLAAVPRMEKILKENNYSHRVESYIYEKGSHALSDGIQEMGAMPKFLMKTIIPAEKKYPKECEEARQDSMKRILAFIEAW